MAGGSKQRYRRNSGSSQHAPEVERMSSRAEEFHLRALPEPCMTLSSHTAPDVRPLPWHKDQWAKSVGLARRSRANQSLPPLVWWRIDLNLRRAHRMT